MNTILSKRTVFTTTPKQGNKSETVFKKKVCPVCGAPSFKKSSGETTCRNSHKNLTPISFEEYNSMWSNKDEIL